MHNLAGRKPHKTSRKKSNRAGRKGVGECGAQGKASPTVNTFGIHLRGHTKLSSNPNGSLVFCCYLFFRVDGAPLFLFFPVFRFCFFFYPISRGQSRAGHGRQHRWRWQGFPGDFEFWFQFGYMKRRMATSCELRAADSELRTQFVSLDKCPASKGKKERNVSSPDVCY